MTHSKLLTFGPTSLQARFGNGLELGAHRSSHAIKSAIRFTVYTLERLVYSTAFLLAVLFVGSLIQPRVGEVWGPLLTHGADLLGRLL